MSDDNENTTTELESDGEDWYPDPVDAAQSGNIFYFL